MQGTAGEVRMNVVKELTYLHGRNGNTHVLCAEYLSLRNMDAVDM